MSIFETLIFEKTGFIAMCHPEPSGGVEYPQHGHAGRFV